MNSIKILGVGEVSGGEYSEIAIHGSSNIKSDVKINKLYVFGGISCNCCISGSEVNINGSIKGECDINVERITVDFSSNCTCNTITSNIVRVIPQKKIYKKKNTFSCKSIYGESVFVSGVEVKSICGKEVCVEGKSHIQEIKYRDKCTISDKAVVNKVIKLADI